MKREYFVFLCMIQHKGMRPHDIPILCRIAWMEPGWKNLDLARDLKISASEVTYSLQRSVQAGLIDATRQKLMRKTMLEFVQYGLPFVFPAVKGAIAVGLPTAHSAPVLKSTFVHDEKIVWPHSNGKVRGESIEPLYPNAVEASLANEEVYAMLALLDAMRVGRTREKKYALSLLEEKLL